MTPALLCRRFAAALFMGSLMFPAAADLKTDLADFLGPDSSTKYIRLAWVKGGAQQHDAFIANFDSHIYGVDSRDGVMRQITSNADFPAGHGLLTYPSITADGQRVVFFNHNTLEVFIINWDGAGLRKLASGYYSTSTWRGANKDWIILVKYGASALGPVLRMNVDNPADTVMLWTKTAVGNPQWGTWENLSDDGTRMAGTFPHPTCEIVGVPNGQVLSKTTEKWGGCWPQIHKSDGSYFFHTRVPHVDIVFFNLQSVEYKVVNLVQPTATTYQQACRWSNDTDIVAFHEDGPGSGPFLFRFSNSAYVKLSNPADQYNGNPDARVLLKSATQNLKPAIVPPGNLSVPLNQAVALDINVSGVPSPTLTAQGLPSCLSVLPAGQAALKFQIAGTCSASGSYRVILTAVNSAGADTDTITVTVGSGSVNKAPVVSAGADQTVSLLDFNARLLGSVTDDGLPSGVLIVRWRQIDGPAKAAIGDSTVQNPLVTFSQVGTCRFQLWASDGALQSVDTTEITAVAGRPFVVIAPKEGDRIRPGQSFVVRWRIDPAQAVGIALSTNNGRTYSDLASPIAMGESTWVWNVPPNAALSDSCFIDVHTYVGTAHARSGRFTVGNSLGAINSVGASRGRLTRDETTLDLYTIRGERIGAAPGNGRDGVKRGPGLAVRIAGGKGRLMGILISRGRAEP